jgi:hypothetical protein
VTLALPHGVDSLEEAMSPNVAKAFRIDVLYGGRTGHRLPDVWRQELVAVLSEADMKTLRDAYADLAEGDVITIAYAPSEGTAVSIGGDPLLSDPHDELIEAFFDLWFGESPVSEDIKESLLEGGTSL